MAHLRLNGVDGSAATIAHSADFDETTIIDMRVDAALDDYVPAQILVARWTQSVAGQCWRLQTSGGPLKIVYQDSAGANHVEGSTVNLSTVVSNGERIQMRGLINAAALTVDFYTRDPALGLALASDTSWTPLGAQVATTGSGAIDTSPNGPIYIGARGGTVEYDEVAAGNFYKAYVRKGGATAIVDVDFADPSTWVYS